MKIVRIALSVFALTAVIAAGLSAPVRAGDGNDYLSGQRGKGDDRFPMSRTMNWTR